MSSFFKLLMLLIISSFASSDVFDNGRQKYEQILSLSSSSSSSSTSSCWQKVLTMLQKYCSIDELDKYQSTIAYQFTLCHLSTMNDDLSNILCHRNNIELCVEELHQHMNAFIAYTEFYPFVQSVCYVLRQKSYQSELTSRLSVFLNNSQETITKLISSIHLQHQLTDRIKYQQYIQETIVNNAIKLKQLARTNMDKTQDILNNVIQAARHEYDLLKQIFNFYQWRLICWSCCLAVLIHFAYKYQSRKEIHNEQLCRLSDNLIQTEATFHRVSRELKRARSKSRSRSRSIRLRQREDKSIPPLIQDKTQSFDYDENKENMKQNHLIDDEDDQSFLNHTNKRHFSLLLPRYVLSFLP
ncbi:unnamed protein product [Rotaria sp. Silwood1]|nr:unnamed protein product [Rotaria sp. Silwood1]